VREETFNVTEANGEVKPVTIFYTVEWLDRDGDQVIEIRLRRTKEGQWLPTEWFNASTLTTDKESTNFTNLFERFFSTSQKL
jgi:hypothetical protein